MADQTETPLLRHIVDATRALYPDAALPAEDPPLRFRDVREAEAAVAAWLRDGADLIHRCRVDRERHYLRGTLIEFATLALADYWTHRGWEQDPLERDAREGWAEEIVAEAEAALMPPGSPFRLLKTEGV